MLRLRSLIGLGVIGSLVLSACSSGASAVPTTATSPAAATASQAPPAASTAAAPTPGPNLTSSIVLINTGGDWGACQRKTFADTFTAKTGVKVVDGRLMDDGQIKAAIEAKTYDADVVFPSANLVLPASGAKYLEPIDYSAIDKTQLAPGTYTDYGVAIDLFSWAFGYRSDQAAPTKLEDFFDTTKYPGKRALVSWDIPTVLEMALMADGVKPADLVPLDVNRALKKLATIKKDIVWFDTGSVGQDLLTSGEVRFAYVYANRITSSRDKGDKVDILWDGQNVQADYVGIPKGGPNVATAQALIAHMVSKDVNGQFSFCQPAGASNTASAVNPANQVELPSSHMSGRFVVGTDPVIAAYVEQHLDEINNAFNTWKAN